MSDSPDAGASRPEAPAPARPRLDTLLLFDFNAAEWCDELGAAC